VETEQDCDNVAHMYDLCATRVGRQAANRFSPTGC